MKKYIITVLSFALALSSCSDYVNKLPENSLPADQTDFTKTENMFQPVSGVYATANNKLSCWALTGMLETRGDDVEKGSRATDQMDFQNAKEFKYNQISGAWVLEQSWNVLYNLILQSDDALVALDNYKQYATTDAGKKLNAQYQAEVRFIRAYTYFFVTRMWGNVPLLLNSADVKTNVPKTSRADMYAFINSELDYCIANLPAVRPNQMMYKGEVTKYTALALKAKAASDLNDWDTALSATNQIINSGLFSLYPDYYQYWKKPGKLSNENLFELQFTDVNAATVTTPDNWFDFQYPRGDIKTANGVVGGGWGFMIPSQQLINLYGARHETVRAKTNLLYSPSITAEGDTIFAGDCPVYNGKVYLPSNQLTVDKINPGSGNNIRMLRYADVLLLNAEAKVRKGQNGDAPLNLVRARSGMPALTAASLDQILQERQIELACEWGERFFDLVRTDKAKSVLPGFVKGSSEFYPIPLGQVDLDPALGE